MITGDNMPLEFIGHPKIEEVEDTHTPSKEHRLDGTLCLLPPEPVGERVASELQQKVA